VWKIESIEECKTPSYDKFIFSHPVTNVTKSLLTVDFEARQEYEKWQTRLFLTYKFFLLMVWLLYMVNEGKDIALSFTWILRFPSESNFTHADPVTAELEETPRDDTTGRTVYKIKAISLRQ